MIRRPKTCYGITLIEVLVSITVILVLAGILTAVLVQARHRAYESMGMQNMRQLGLAASLYRDQAGDHPLGTAVLVDTGLVPPEICSSPADHFPAGFANRLIEDISVHDSTFMALRVDYRSTYVGPREYRYGSSLFSEFVAEQPAAGWLVDLTRSEPRSETSLLSRYEGSYRRLLLDGSVVNRRHKALDVGAAGAPSLASHPFFMFCDGDQAWMQHLYRKL